MSKKFTHDYLVNELDLPYNNALVISDEIVDTGRWTVVHELIFRDPADGRAYKVFYDVGATEMQDGLPWEYEDNIDAVEMELKTVTIEKWVPVAND